MTAFVGTNILVRHLTGDPLAMAARALRRRWTSSGTFRIWRVFMQSAYKGADCMQAVSASAEVIGVVSALPAGLSSGTGPQ